MNINSLVAETFGHTSDDFHEPFRREQSSLWNGSYFLKCLKKHIRVPWIYYVPEARQRNFNKPDIFKSNLPFFPITLIMPCDLLPKQWGSVLGAENHSVMFTRDWDNNGREA